MAKRENLYSIQIFWTDEKDPRGYGNRVWRKVAVDDKRTWEKAEKSIRRLFPTVTHVNVYGGVTREFKKQIKLTP